MNDWTAGYVAEIDYTYGYYPELNPLRAKLSLLNAGLVLPEFENASELGFGQGMSVNLHAAATSIHWSGTDFNPSQAGFANELNGITGAQAKLYDESFAEFVTRTDLPAFDFIGLHGIWSWISHENRALIIEFVRRRLKIGGVLYISYNTLPGWAAFAPMRHMMSQYAESLGAVGRPIVKRIDDAIDFVDKLVATHPAYVRDSANVEERFKKLKDLNRHYLAHEYFNRDWHPVYFSEIAQQLVSAKSQFACSANFFDLVDDVNLSAEQQTLLKEIPDPIFREGVRDVMVNQQFRRDYWVKGIRKHNVLDRVEELRMQRVVLANTRENLSLKVKGAHGEANMKEEVYFPIIDFLSDYKTKTIAQIEKEVASKNISFPQLLQAIMVLTNTGFLSVAQNDTQISTAKKHTDKLNAYLISKARGNGDIIYLASPVTGGGINVDRFQQLFLLGFSQGVRDPVELAKQVWQVVSSQGQKLIKEGKTLETLDESIAELTSQAKVFIEKRLPILKALQIA